MIKRKIILFFAILLIVSQIGFFISSESSGDGAALLEELNTLQKAGNINYSLLDDGRTINIEIKTDKFKIGDNVLESVNFKDGESSIKLDYLTGDIIEADLFNSKEAKYNINGNEFEIPEDSYFSYKDGVYQLSKNAKINKLQINSTIVGDGVSFFGGDLVTKSDLDQHAKIVYTKDGYILKAGKAIYKGLEIDSIGGTSDIFIVKDNNLDLSNYKGKWIKQNKDGLKIQSSSEESPMLINFMEGNDFFDMNNDGLEGNKQKYVSLYLGGGDGVEIFNFSEYFGNALPSKIRHIGNEGFTTIKDGRQIIKFNNGEYFMNFGNLNTQNLIAVPLDIDSNDLPGKVISIDDNSGYLLTEITPDGEVNYQSIDSSIYTDPKKPFTSKIGEKIYEYAEKEVGNAGFVHSGRGDVCYTWKDGRYVQEKTPEGIHAYDCIGFALTGLIEAGYPDMSLNQLPPNLKLADVLKQKGWKTKIIEPSSLIGEEKAAEDVYNIPPGAIVFLMHPYLHKGSQEGVDYLKYTNSKNEDVNIILGHTLIRGRGKNNFLNAIPTPIRDFLPLKAKALDEKRISRGQAPIFEGVVKEGSFVPQQDYLYVIVPPEDKTTNP